MTSDWTTTPITGEELAALGAKLDAFAAALAPREKLILASLLSGLVQHASDEVRGYTPALPLGASLSGLPPLPHLPLTGATLSPALAALLPDLAASLTSLTERLGPLTPQS
jgi:hypothetical protein